MFTTFKAVPEFGIFSYEEDDLTYQKVKLPKDYEPMLSDASRVYGSKLLFTDDKELYEFSENETVMLLKLVPE